MPDFIFLIYVWRLEYDSHCLVMLVLAIPTLHAGGLCHMLFQPMWKCMYQEHYKQQPNHFIHAIPRAL